MLSWLAKEAACFIGKKVFGMAAEDVRDLITGKYDEDENAKTICIARAEAMTNEAIYGNDF